MTTTVNSATSSVNSAVATSPVTAVASSVVTPVAAAVVQTPAIDADISPLVNSVSANTTTQDGSGVAASTLLYQTNYPMLVGADTLQRAGITGKGVTIAVLDTGLWQDVSQNYAARVLATIDVLNGGSGPVKGDPYGHGTHITSIAAGGALNLGGGYLSITPRPTWSSCMPSTGRAPAGMSM